MDMLPDYILRPPKKDVQGMVHLDELFQVSNLERYAIFAMCSFGFFFLGS